MALRAASGRRKRRAARRRALRLFGAAEVALLVPLLACERRMRASGGPGIIPFELAGTEMRARRILERWGPSGRAAAKLSLVLDYPYLVTYAGGQFLWCQAASDALRDRGAGALADAGRFVAPAQVAAAAFDAAENTALLAILSGGMGRLPAIARGCALAKFVLLIAGWSYATAGLAARVAPRRA